MVNFKTGNRGERRIYFLPSLKSGWFSTRVFAFILFASKNNILFFPSNKRKTTPNKRIGDSGVETLKRDKPAP